MGLCSVVLSSDCSLSFRSVEGEFEGIGKRGKACVQLARILQYLECPQLVHCDQIEYLISGRTKMIATDDLHASLMLEALGAGDKLCVCSMICRNTGSDYFMCGSV